MGSPARSSVIIVFRSLVMYRSAWSTEYSRTTSPRVDGTARARKVSLRRGSVTTRRSAWLSASGFVRSLLSSKRAHAKMCDRFSTRTSTLARWYRYEAARAAGRAARLFLLEVDADAAPPPDAAAAAGAAAAAVGVCVAAAEGGSVGVVAAVPSASFSGSGSPERRDGDLGSLAAKARRRRRRRPPARRRGWRRSRGGRGARCARGDGASAAAQTA